MHNSNRIELSKVVAKMYTDGERCLGPFSSDHDKLTIEVDVEDFETGGVSSVALSGDDYPYIRLALLVLSLNEKVDVKDEVDEARMDITSSADPFYDG